MCDGDYGGGCGDPDYYDLEFREQNPHVYGDDEYMQAYRGTSGKGNASRSQPRQSNVPEELRKQFHEEYVAWKKRQPKTKQTVQTIRQQPQQKESPSGPVSWLYMLAGLAIYTFFVFAMIYSCCGD
ncbi:MAG: hypothetical protein K5893_12205 [Prevotella sp.]|nr:hypothetical protein [Prevotella sp.]